MVGQWGEGSKDLHHFIQTCAEAREAHLTRASDRQESEHLLGLIVGQYRRLLSITVVRAQAMCLSIAFEDLLGSSIAPHVLPHWALVEYGLQSKKRDGWSGWVSGVANTP